MKKICLLVMLIGTVCGSLFAKDYEKPLEEWNCVLAVSSINKNNVDIYLLPNSSAMKIGKLNKDDTVVIKGFSEKKSKLGFSEGYWVKIKMERSLDGYAWDALGGYGWVFAKYVDVNPSLEASTMKAVDFVSWDKEKLSGCIDLEIDRNGEKYVGNVGVYRFKGQENYTFIWNDECNGFKYCDPVGTFRWNPETNEITHVAYMGSKGESEWSILSNDGRYLFSDLMGAVYVAYDTATNEAVYSAKYFSFPEYDGVTISAYELYDLNNERMSAETKKHVEDYFQLNGKKSGEFYVEYKTEVGTWKRTFVSVFNRKSRQ